MAKLKAKDAFYDDALKQVEPGAVFETTDFHAQQLVAAGLAEAVQVPADPNSGASVAKRAAKRARKV